MLLLPDNPQTGQDGPVECLGMNEPVLGPTSIGLEKLIFF